MGRRRRRHRPVLGADAASSDGARIYLLVQTAAAPAHAVAYAAGTVLRASGDTKTPMRVAAVANALNIFGNWVLIFGHFGFPEMGVKGAAIATATAHVAEMVMLAVVIFRTRGPVRITLGDLARPHLESAREIARISVPSAGEQAVFHAGFLLFSRAVTGLGEVAMAAHQAAISIESLSFMPADGFGTAAATVVGQKLGAGRPDHASYGGRIATGLSVGFLCLTGVAYLLAADFLVAAFSTDLAVRSVGATVLRISAIEQPFMAAGITLGHGLRGAGDTRSPFGSTVLGIWLVRLPLTYGLAYGLGLGLAGAWLAAAVDWLVRGSALWVIFRRGAWQSVRVGSG